MSSLRVAFVLCCALLPMTTSAQGSRHVEVRLDAAAAQAHASGRLLVFAMPAAKAEAAAKDGKVVEQGDAQSIFDNPQHPYTRELLQASSLKTQETALADVV